MTLLYEQTNGGAQDQNDYRICFKSEFTTGYSFSNVNKVTFWLKKGSGSPTGTVQAAFWSGADLPLNESNLSTTTLDVSTLTSSFAEYEFDFDPIFSTGSSPFGIGLVFSSTSSTNYVSFELSNTSLSDRTSNRSEPHGSSPTSWTTMSNPFKMKIYAGSVSSDTLLFPPPVAYI